MTEIATRNDDDVIEGRIVADDDASTRPVVVLNLTQIVTTARKAVAHKHTRTTGRHLGYVPLGGYAIGRRIWEARSSGVYDKRISAALAAGDNVSALEWEERRARFLNDRHRRRMERRASMLTVVKASPYIAAGGVGVLLLIGAALGIAEHNIKDVALPIEVVAKAIEIVVVVVSVAWGPALLAAPWVLVAALWHAGRKFAQTSNAPGWLRSASDADEDGGLVLTADTIVLALQHIGIPELNKAFKAGWQPTFTLTPTRDGNAYEAEFSVPLGVTPEMIADRRPVAARNLHRDQVETWISAGQPGNVRLWVADRGALDGLAPEYPLMHEGTADVFAGVPAGVTPRGDVLNMPLFANNFVLGGQMGMGKSNAARVAMLGAALDPLCELNVFVFASNGDFDEYAPRLAVYRKG